MSINEAAATFPNQGAASPSHTREGKGLIYKLFLPNGISIKIRINEVSDRCVHEPCPLRPKRLFTSSSVRELLSNMPFLQFVLRQLF